MSRRGIFGVAAAATGVVAAGLGAGLALQRRGRPRPANLAGLGGPLPGVEGTVRAGDGVPLVTVTGGDLTAPVTVVLVHGYCLDMRCWHFQWRALGARARLVGYDQRSHGRSGRARDTDTTRVLDQLGRDLGTVLDELVPTGPVVLVGHSMGGMTVMALAAARPELFGDRVRGVALLSTSAGKLGEATFGLPAAIAILARRVVPWAVPRLGRQAALVDRGRAAAHPELMRLLFRYYSFRSAVPPAVVDLVADMIGNTPFEVIADFFPAFASHDKLAALGVLRPVDTLVLAGAGDLITPADHARDIAAALPGAELCVVPEAGHLVPLEHPDLVNERLAALLGRVAERLL